ncbi:type VI secretion system Vgr family protein [Pseudomonas syringae]|uniref:type VI secretion system Vgr family protein n=1 Tax=Pseudomonas syringae TaxID=317 RepID=UPI0005C8955B|nr:type VI secretion system tip protein TssI/VgrG [Pseudomonas syringae]POD34711.1 type IV secretion protein Rhs [Pseudomonas syringae pv. syringae]SFH66359.1 type VI secretion system secreted protein VgrG [Pseudomonas syringae]
MRKDLQVPFMLAITDCQPDLHIISFAGHEALNETYRFDIWMIGSDPQLDVRSLLHREAFLSFGESGSGRHGLIDHAARLHRGARMSLYHLILVPDLQRLVQHRQRRTYQDLAIPQLIVQLLEAHSIGANAYRFEHVNGLYPARPLHIQYDESDLHLLQRLCEEEGMHFRFEHRQSGHRLVFSDDPASFPAQPLPVRFKHPQTSGAPRETLEHLAERLGFPPVSRQPTDHPQPARAPEHPLTIAANHAFQPPGFRGAISPQEALSRQRGSRRLERLRCERRDVRGRSTDTALQCGEVIQVLDHPEPMLNDQWLVTETAHAGRQLQVLKGAAAHDALAILRILVEAQRSSPEAEQLQGNGYCNSFRVIPWATPFRPSVNHPRPAATGEHFATLQRNDTQPVQPGYRSIRFDWHVQSPQDEPVQRWPMAEVACPEVDRLAPGTRVRVRFLDNHPERPVICAVLSPGHELDGITAQPAGCIRVASGEHLHVNAHDGLLVRGQAAALHVDAQRILIVGHKDQQSLKSGWRLSIKARMPSF